MAIRKIKRKFIKKIKRKFIRKIKKKRKLKKEKIVGNEGLSFMTEDRCPRCTSRLMSDTEIMWCMYVFCDYWIDVKTVNKFKHIKND